MLKDVCDIKEAQEIRLSKERNISTAIVCKYALFVDSVKVFVNCTSAL